MRENIILIRSTLENMAKTNELEFKLYDEKIKVANNRIKDLEDNSKWVWRAIVGALIAGAIALLYK
ncbi:MAG: hemolysin XhlA family protein [Clostridium sp.]